MDRDAPFSYSPTSSADVVPPVCWETARAVGLAGAGMVAGAAALGLVATAIGDGTPWPLQTARLALVFLGTITAGLAVSFRPDRWQAWAIGVTAAVLAVPGTPAHWDSFRLLFGVLAGVGAFRLAFAVASPRLRVAAISTLIVLHFFGIFLATTSPSPTPWLVDQLYRRVYDQYLQFVYLRNAYHFYSPEPGPASLLLCLLETEVPDQRTATGEKVFKREWVVVPKRPQDIRDPLGVTYYRRLSITEQVSRGAPDFLTPNTFEKSDVLFRRRQAEIGNPAIPFHPTDAPIIQYRLPEPMISRYLLPSYARYMLLNYTPDAETAGRTTLKIYRVEHRTLGVTEFVGVTNPGKKPGDPYHPVTYRPYFLGEFRFAPDPDHPGQTRVELKDPQEPMLYWLVPVIGRPNGSVPGDPDKKDYVDYMSRHAGLEFDWSQLR